MARRLTRNIAITRNPTDAAEFCELVRRRGATPLALPTIRLVARKTNVATEFLASARSANPDYTVFLSSRAVDVLFESARKVGLDSELSHVIGATSIICVGPKTQEALEAHNMCASHIAATHSSIGIGELFTSLDTSHARRVIIPRSAAANEFLRALLEKIGLAVTEVDLYDVAPDGQGGDWTEFHRLAQDSEIYAIIFTSASTVRAFGRLADLDSLVRNTRLVAIGPFTSMELKRAHLEHTVSSVHTVSGALDELLAS